MRSRPYRSWTRSSTRKALGPLPRPISNTSTRRRARRSPPEISTGRGWIQWPRNTLPTFPKIKLFTLADVVGDWHKTQTVHFADGGVFDQIYQPSAVRDSQPTPFQECGHGGRAMKLVFQATEHPAGFRAVARLHRVLFVPDRPDSAVRHFPEGVHAHLASVLARGSLAARAGFLSAELRRVADRRLDQSGLRRSGGVGAGALQLSAASGSSIR